MTTLYPICTNDFLMCQVPKLGTFLINNGLNKFTHRRMNGRTMWYKILTPNGCSPTNMRRWNRSILAVRESDARSQHLSISLFHTNDSYMHYKHNKSLTCKHLVLQHKYVQCARIIITYIAMHLHIDADATQHMRIAGSHMCKHRSSSYNTHTFSIKRHAATQL